MPKPNPLKLSECKPGLEVAVYIPELTRPLYGVITRAWRERAGTRVQLVVYRRHEKATIIVDLDQIVPW